MEPTKKPKSKYFNVVKSEAEKQINEIFITKWLDRCKKYIYGWYWCNAVVWSIDYIKDELNQNAMHMFITIKKFERRIIVE